MHNPISAGKALGSRPDMRFVAGIRPPLRPLLLLISLLFIGVFVTPALADCKQAEALLDKPAQRLQVLIEQRNRLEKLLSGRLSASFDISKNVPVALDRELDVFRARHELAVKESDTDSSEIPAALEDCPPLEKKWNSLQYQLSSEKDLLRQQQIQLYDLPKPTRQALVRVLGQWQTLYELQKEADQWAEKDAESPDTVALVNQVNQWIDLWRDATRNWLSQLHHNSPAGSDSNNIWGLTPQVPNADEAADWVNYVESHSEGESPDLLSWLDQMEAAESALLRESSKWRNKKIWDLGWAHFFKDLTKPRSFWRQLANEASEAPTNLFDAVTRPFIREYRRSLRLGNRGELLSEWFLQTLALIGIMSGLMRFARTVPGAISRIQQNLLGSLQHKLLLQFNSAFMWFIKPNAPWLVVLVGTNLIAYYVPAEWIILKWLGPIGTLYSVFRAARVLLEWMISRTFTRSGQFVPTSAAENQAADAHTVSWVVVLCFLSWVLVKGTGGGYLMFFNIIFNFALCWAGLLWLMLRYREGVARFFLFVTGKGKGKNLDAGSAQKWWMILIWPLLFVLAHIVDVVLNMHQKLMVFDTYRSISIKLMRWRLAAEAKDEEGETEKDETLPDENYREWMLMDEGKPSLDINILSHVLTPIQLWNKDKSDDNVLLIVGDQGSGKSTLLNSLQEKWEDTTISMLRIPPKTTNNELLFSLLASHLGLEKLNSVSDLVKHCDGLEPQVLIIENTQNLFLSEVGYLNAYRLFNQCLNANIPNIYWVVVMHSQSSIYLSCVFNRELRFTNVFKMPRWSPADIRRLILSRHQGSRRTLKYDELLLSASAGSESSSIRAADSRVFNILWEQSGGNPQIAIQLWVEASRSRERVVDIGVPAKPGNTLLKELKDDLCFIYASIIIHKSLSGDEIMLVTHYAEPIVRHALKQGLHLGLLRRDETKRYRIDPIWQGTIISFLISKNMLWNM
ncbi:ATP-binding protein [Ketobacter sp. MCCC 1A13808]|uniref:ATP-binding protein n=1 Tax=Ketobacter sp. MCCC 1A13808 TaxID=2602738 RepID=UPI0012EC0E15|nr:ATP-binding protein [Ketobacter sp. MCCC 1A13808]MVF11342.1 ATP-binding protein [Ketobacter sp. MCCC 1A13808]